MDGIQDENESGIADVTVKLYNGSGDELSSTTTDSDGKYEFCDLSRGDYYIIVDKDTLPYGYKITEQNAGDDDDNDSDINATDGKSDTVTISENNITNLDGGAYSTYCLGDMIWDDKDADGIQDDGEEGLSDVNITLYRVNNDGTSTEVNSTTTDSDGKYQFCDLVAR